MVTAARGGAVELAMTVVVEVSSLISAVTRVPVVQGRRRLLSSGSPM